MAPSSSASTPPPAHPARPSWKEGAIWMGASAGALGRLWSRHGFAIDGRCSLEAAIDALFACGNSLLGLVDTLVSSRRTSQIELDPPVFILGHWRTGTTFLHELLNLDPRLRCPTSYECFVPHHFPLTQRWLARWTGFALPRTRSFDNMSVGWERPQEDEFALLNLGVPSPYSRIAFPRGPAADDAWLDLDALSERERRRWGETLVRFGRRLVAVRPGRLVLKSPPHTCRLPTLARLFPQARYVYLVRDPQDVIPSTLRLWRTLFATYGYQRPIEEGLTEWVLDTFGHFHDRFTATSHLVPSTHLQVLCYEDLVAAPERHLRSIYETLELGDYSPVADRVASFCAGQREYRRHPYPTDLCLADEIQTRCASYRAFHESQRTR